MQRKHRGQRAATAECPRTFNRYLPQHHEAPSEHFSTRLHKLSLIMEHLSTKELLKANENQSTAAT